ncbi:hypothetical protein NIA71_08635 [Ihubacter massiliensis]|uniref:hypothetical protein n=1 Tax=Ihubacter massiliensis TaxID=1852367 RepID=UPI0011DDD329|nr:hypothetical protein [Ihubacter massiliensis]MCO7121902.1 hypothetical protein [Ihubacter massiliensis]MCO7122013.1 hypothetical protein [Ihubacter massiliensis]
METALTMLLSLATTVIAGVALHAIKSGQKKAQSREEDRDKREQLTLEAINASFCVNKELVSCVLDGKPANGELDEAYEYQRNVKHKIEDYAREKASRS